jgi:tetratricopeptide (TPR) repeat protein
VAKLIRYNDPQDAIEDYQAAIERDKEFGAAHYGLAMAHGDLGNYDQAIDAMREARRLDVSIEPDSDVDGAVWISRWHASAGRTDEAIQTLEEHLLE